MVERIIVTPSEIQLTTPITDDEKQDIQIQFPPSTDPRAPRRRCKFAITAQQPSKHKLSIKPTMGFLTEGGPTVTVHVTCKAAASAAAVGPHATSLFMNEDHLLITFTPEATGFGNRPRRLDVPILYQQSTSAIDQPSTNQPNAAEKTATASEARVSLIVKPVSGKTDKQLPTTSAESRTSTSEVQIGSYASHTTDTNATTSTGSVSADAIQPAPALTTTSNEKPKDSTKHDHETGAATDRDKKANEKEEKKSEDSMAEKDQAKKCEKEQQTSDRDTTKEETEKKKQTAEKASGLDNNETECSREKQNEKETSQDKTSTSKTEEKSNPDRDSKLKQNKKKEKMTGEHHDHESSSHEEDSGDEHDGAKQSSESPKTSPTASPRTI